MDVLVMFRYSRCLVGMYDMVTLEADYEHMMEISIRGYFILIGQERDHYSPYEDSQQGSLQNG